MKDNVVVITGASKGIGAELGRQLAGKGAMLALVARDRAALEKVASECVALGAALLGDSLDAIDSVTLVDVLSMPIGIATPNSQFRRVLDKNTTIPSSRSFRLPPPREPGQPIEIDIYQGASDQIVDNEFLGSIRLPAVATGRRIDFKLDEDCLLKVSFDDPEKGMTELQIATRDTPDALRRALAEAAAASAPAPGEGRPAAGERRGIFGWLKRG